MMNKLTITLGVDLFGGRRSEITFEATLDADGFSHPTAPYMITSGACTFHAMNLYDVYAHLKPSADDSNFKSFGTFRKSVLEWTQKVSEEELWDDYIDFEIDNELEK